MEILFWETIILLNNENSQFKRVSKNKLLKSINEIFLEVAIQFRSKLQINFN